MCSTTWRPRISFASRVYVTPGMSSPLGPTAPPADAGASAARRARRRSRARKDMPKRYDAEARFLSRAPGAEKRSLRTLARELALGGLDQRAHLLGEPPRSLPPAGELGAGGRPAPPPAPPARPRR